MLHRASPASASAWVKAAGAVPQPYCWFCVVQSQPPVHDVHDVFRPSAPRTRRRTLTLSQLPRRRGCRLRSPMRTPACCQPFGSGTVQRRAAIACMLIFTSQSALERWLSGEVRARRMARRSDEYSARSRCYSTQPHSTTIEESRITRMQKGTIIKGRTPFCHHQCCCDRRDLVVLCVVLCTFCLYLLCI